MQSDPLAATDCPIKIGSGLCAYYPLHQPDHYIPLHASHPKYIRLVVAANMLGSSDVWSGDMGMPVERIEAHDVWRQWNEAAGRYQGDRG